MRYMNILRSPSTEAGSAQAIERDITKSGGDDASGPGTLQGWNDLSQDVQAAVASNHVEAVAKQLEKDGYPTAAGYLRNQVGDDGPDSDDDGISDLISAMMLASLSDDDGPDELDD